MSGDIQNANATSSTRKGGPHRRPRKRLSCDPCRNAKLRCNRQHPCSACERRECVEACKFGVRGDTATVLPSASVVGVLPQIHGSTSPQAPSLLDTHQSSAPHVYHGIENQPPPDKENLSSFVPLSSMLERPVSGQDEGVSGPGSAWEVDFRFGPKVPIEELLSMLPSGPTCEYLVSRYFAYQAPLFHVLHGPTFQKQYAEFIQNPTSTAASWLALLFVICSLAIHTLDTGDPIIDEYWSVRTKTHSSGDDHLRLSRHLRSAALTCLSEAQFMVRHDLNTLEALLVMIYGVCHSDGVDRAWTFLGVAFNIGIALRCNIGSLKLNCIEKERRRRCWAGILMLHTYQGLIFRDIDMSFLLNIPAIMPMDVNDSDIREDAIQEPSSRPTSMSLMRFKIRLFDLSTKICSQIAEPSTFDQASMRHFDSLIAKEQEQWSSLFLPEGSLSLLDTARYAYWCVLDTYAHQLNLLIHRPFHDAQSHQFLPSSRDKYLKSALGLLELHRQLCEYPTLRPYRWLVNGMTSFNALQAAVALASCLMKDSVCEETKNPHRASFDAAVRRIESLQKSSPVCAKAYPALKNLQIQLSNLDDHDIEGPSVEWDTSIGWLDETSVDWAYWDSIIGDINQEGF